MKARIEELVLSTYVALSAGENFNTAMRFALTALAEECYERAAGVAEPSYSLSKNAPGTAAILDEKAAKIRKLKEGLK
jgi:hypothetical protein